LRRQGIDENHDDDDEDTGYSNDDFYIVQKDIATMSVKMAVGVMTTTQLVMKWQYSRRHKWSMVLNGSDRSAVSTTNSSSSFVQAGRFQTRH
jgi:hypothetical protein